MLAKMEKKINYTEKQQKIKPAAPVMKLDNKVDGETVAPNYDIERFVDQA